MVTTSRAVTHQVQLTAIHTPIHRVGGKRHVIQTRFEWLCPGENRSAGGPPDTQVSAARRRRRSAAGRIGPRSHGSGKGFCLKALTTIPNFETRFNGHEPPSRLNIATAKRIADKRP